MDRSFAARLVRPFGVPATRRGVSRPRRVVRAGGSSRAPGRGRVRAGEAPLAGLLRAGNARVVELAHALWCGRRTRIALLCVTAAIPLLLGGFMLLRNSSFVAVQRVGVSGVHGPQATAIESALVAAGRHMSTLNVNHGALRSAVSAFPLVREVKAYPQVPHGLRITVVEQPPVAAMQIGSLKTAVAADGVVLGPALLTGTLPVVGGFRLPLPGEHLHDAGLLGFLAVLGAAPTPLARMVTRVYNGPEGVTVRMHNGLLAYFGDATRPHAKWFSLARVLADHSSAGASYVDVRLPGRPAAGFPEGAGPVSAAAAEGTTMGGETSKESESTVAALAAGLHAGGSSTAPASPVEPAAGASAEEHPSSTQSGETPTSQTSGESAESRSSTETEASTSGATPGG